MAVINLDNKIKLEKTLDVTLLGKDWKLDPQVISMAMADLMPLADMFLNVGKNTTEDQAIELLIKFQANQDKLLNWFDMVFKPGFGAEIAATYHNNSVKLIQIMQLIANETTKLNNANQRKKKQKYLGKQNA